MNIFISICTDYIRSSRTIETIKVFNSKNEKIFYVYNYEGNSFRVFNNILNLISFFEDKSNDFMHFDTEKEVDNYFSKVLIE